MGDQKPQIAIVDFGLGNLFSVKQACEYVGIRAEITSSPEVIIAADGVILPGVGAYGDAMKALNALDLVSPLIYFAQSGKYLFGICLGMQLLMTESYEFGTHKGLGIVDGIVVPFEDPVDADFLDGPSRRLKVPQVGWNQMWKNNKSNQSHGSEQKTTWDDSPLAGLPDGEYMYFVHSFYVKPENEKLSLSVTHYGQIGFCSSLQYNSIFACQFHPERSSKQGIQVYKNIASLLGSSLE